MVPVVSTRKWSRWSVLALVLGTIVGLGVSALGAPDAINPETGECFGGGEVQPDLFVSLNLGFIIAQVISIHMQ